MSAEPLKRIAYSPEEVGDMLGLTANDIRHRLRTGELVGIKLGRTWRIRVEVLDAYLASRENH